MELQDAQVAEAQDGLRFDCILKQAAEFFVVDAIHDFLCRSFWRFVIAVLTWELLMILVEFLILKVCCEGPL